MSKRAAAYQLNHDNFECQVDDNEDLNEKVNNNESSSVQNRTIRKAIRRSNVDKIPNETQKFNLFSSFKGFSNFNQTNSITNIKTVDISLPQNLGSTAANLNLEGSFISSTQKCDNTVGSNFSLGCPFNILNPVNQLTTQKNDIIKSDSNINASSIMSPFIGTTIISDNYNIDKQELTFKSPSSFKNLTKSNHADESNKSNDASCCKKDFYSNVVSLNKQLIDWIQLHFQKSQCLDLRPVFSDYFNHYSKLVDTIKSSNDSVIPFLSKQIEDKCYKSVETIPDSSVHKFSNLSSHSLFKTDGSSEKTEIFSQQSEMLKPLGVSTLTNNKNDFKFTWSSIPLVSNEVSNSLFSSPSNPSKDNTFSNVFNFKPIQIKDKLAVNNESKCDNAVSDEETEVSNSVEEEIIEKNKEFDEPDSFFSVRCKVHKKFENSWLDLGIGKCFLKKKETTQISDKKAIQMIIRVENSSVGRVLVNSLIYPNETPVTKKSDKDILMVLTNFEDAKAPCAYIIRTSTKEYGDELLKYLKDQ